MPATAANTTSPSDAEAGPAGPRHMLARWWRGWSTLTASDTLDFPFAPSDVVALGVHHGDAGAGAPDEKTWNDLLLTSYLARLTPGTSIFGQQVLDRRLRHGVPATAAATTRLRALMAAPDLLPALQTACRPLRQADAEVSAVLFGPAPAPAPWWSRRLSLVPLALLVVVALAVGLSVWTQGVAWLAWLAVVAIWMGLLAIQSRFRDEAEEWQRSVKTLQLMLATHGNLAALPPPWLAPLREGRASAGTVARALRQSVLPRMNMLGEYADGVLLANIKYYFHTREVVRRDAALLRDVFLAVAELEADVALARHLQTAPAWCWPQRADAAGNGKRLLLDGMVHPLLAAAAPLSIVLDGKGAFISGQNGIGKSTLLRCIGLNVLVARAFGFCYAASATVPTLAVYASMQSEDSLDGGESLYLAELRRAQQLLALAERPVPALFIIDEIFRGTNHLESISAAAAVLHTLTEHALVLVSSHNLVLAPLLDGCLAPWCVSAPAAGQGTLQLAPGVLADTNGLALLAAREFGAAIEGKAARVFDWLSGYMTQPADCGGLLDTSS